MKSVENEGQVPEQESAQPHKFKPGSHTGIVYEWHQTGLTREQMVEQGILSRAQIKAAFGHLYRSEILPTPQTNIDIVLGWHQHGMNRGQMMQQGKLTPMQIDKVYYTLQTEGFISPNGEIAKTTSNSLVQRKKMRAPAEGIINAAVLEAIQQGISRENLPDYTGLPRKKVNSAIAQLRIRGIIPPATQEEVTKLKKEVLFRKKESIWLDIAGYAVLGLTPREIQAAARIESVKDFPLKRIIAAVNKQRGRAKDIRLQRSPEDKLDVRTVATDSPEVLEKRVRDILSIKKIFERAGLPLPIARTDWKVLIPFFQLTNAMNNDASSEEIIDLEIQIASIPPERISALEAQIHELQNPGQVNQVDSLAQNSLSMEFPAGSNIGLVYKWYQEGMSKTDMQQQGILSIEQINNAISMLRSKRKIPHAKKIASDIKYDVKIEKEVKFNKYTAITALVQRKIPLQVIVHIIGSPIEQVREYVGYLADQKKISFHKIIDDTDLEEESSEDQEKDTFIKEAFSWGFFKGEAYWERLLQIYDVYKRKLPENPRDRLRLEMLLKVYASLADEDPSARIQFNRAANKSDYKFFDERSKWEEQIFIRDVIDMLKKESERRSQ